jgi:Protein of unknown function (DUF4242)
MPRFTDFHDDLKLPAEAIEQIAARTQAGATDEFGGRQIELYHNAGGKVYCLLQGPDEEAIRKHHQARSIPLRRRAPGEQPALNQRDRFRTGFVRLVAEYEDRSCRPRR